MNHLKTFTGWFNPPLILHALLAQSIHGNWMFDCKLFEGMSLWQTHLKQPAHAVVPALAGMLVS